MRKRHQRAERERQHANHHGTESDRPARITNGQPILVGHRSENRHRRDLDKLHRHNRQYVEGHRYADVLDRQAESVGKGGISSDDPEAVTKLPQRLTDLEQQRDRCKRINAYWKKHRSLDGCPYLSPDATAKLDTSGSMDVVQHVFRLLGAGCKWSGEVADAPA